MEQENKPPCAGRTYSTLPAEPSLTQDALSETIDSSRLLRTLSDVPIPYRPNEQLHERLKLRLTRQAPQQPKTESVIKHRTPTLSKSNSNSIHTHPSSSVREPRLLLNLVDIGWNHFSNLKSSQLSCKKEQRVFLMFVLVSERHFEERPFGDYSHYIKFCGKS